MANGTFKALTADKAINLFNGLIAARQLQLHPALARAVQAIGVVVIDGQLHELVPASALDCVAMLGLRGELVFPVPVVLQYNPALLGYYRMLLGLSKKEFGNILGYGRWVTAENRGTIPPRLESELPQLCAAFITPLTQLVDAMGTFGERDLSDLALLTLGPTLQGGRNNVIGVKAAQAVFASVRALFESQISHESENRFEFTTSDGHHFVVVAASDPDLRLDEIIDSHEAPIVAIEIKGGGDASNAHNRAGEAEKSQIKARGLGFNQRWTVINMGTIPPNQSRAETPTTTELFEARDVINRSGPDWDRFSRLLNSLLGEAGDIDLR